MTRPRASARIAGALYLLTHVTSVTAVIAYDGDLIALGVALEFLLALGCVGTGILLWMLLRDRVPIRAMTFLQLRALEAAVILAGTLPMLTLLWSRAEAPLDDVLRSAHLAAFLVGQGLVISINTIVLGWMLWSARAVPPPLAVLGVGGGVLVLASNAAQLFGAIPLGGAIAGACAAPVFVFEIWLALHLLIRGVHQRRADTATARVPEAA